MPLTQTGFFELAPDLRRQRQALVAAARARLAGAAADPVIARAIEPAPVAATSNPGTPLHRSVDVAAVRAGSQLLLPAASPIEPPEREAPRGQPVRRPSRDAARPQATPARTTPRRSDAVSAKRNPISSPLAQERMKFVLEQDGRMTVDEMARELGISSALIVRYRMRLADQGRITIRRHPERRDWTEQEDQYLRAHIGARSIREMAQHLDRTLASIFIRTKRLGLSRRAGRRAAGTLNASDVGAILGTDISFVQRGLIPWGLLKAERHGWLESGKNKCWAIRREDLVDFLLDHPWQYDRSRIRDPFFRRVADEAWKRDPLYTAHEAARMFGLADGGSFQMFLTKQLPRILPASQIVIRRKGDPRAKGKSLIGMKMFVHRSLIELIRRSGWAGWRAVTTDHKRPTAETAAELLLERADRPAYLTKSALIARIRRFYKGGVIPSVELTVGHRRIVVARSFGDVLAVKDALFARQSAQLVLNSYRRAMIERHDPSWLTRHQDLALALADGRMATLLRAWWEAEQVAARELRWTKARLWAFVTPHVARVLEQLGPRTKYVGGRGRSQYHRIPHVARLVRIPLPDARRHGLTECEHCAFERRHRVVRPTRELPVCSSCSKTYKRGRGRPPKVALCPTCAHRQPDRRAA